MSPTSIKQPPSERLVQTQNVMLFLDACGLNAEQQVDILGLPAETRSRILRRFRDDTPFPDTPKVSERFVHLLGIIDALSTTYPCNAEMGPGWMHAPHRRFKKRSPLSTILEDGLGGLVSVRAHLDCTFAWQNNI